MMIQIACISLCLLVVVDSFQNSLRIMKIKSSIMINQMSKSQSNWELSLLSPCKINLFLRILERRPTGYHDLASLFQAISLSDNMHFNILGKDATRDILTCSDTTLSVDGSNLVVKALNLMRNKTGIKQYFQVHLDKEVPIQAGLGGGSGNAATAMYAFNKLCGFPVSLEDLRLWSGDIGSDITFFFTSGTAYCTGRGEIVTSMDPLPESDDTVVHIFKPREGLSTALVFKTLQLGKVSPSSPESLLGQYKQVGALKSAEAGLLINDLEPPSFQCEPVLLRIKESIAANGGLKSDKPSISGVMMSGSGTSVYALERKSSISLFEPKNLLKEYPTLRHFKCRFISKSDDVQSWYL